MSFALLHRPELRRISVFLEDEFDRLIGALQRWAANVTTNALTASTFRLNGSTQPPVTWAVTTSNYSTTSATLANVTGLSVTLAKRTSYAFEALLHVPTALQVSVALGGTATAGSVMGDPSISYLIEMIDTTANVFDMTHGSHTGYGLGQRHDSVAGTGYLTIRWTGWLTTEYAGTLTIQFAKVVGGGSQATVRRGSWLKVYQLT